MVGALDSGSSGPGFEPWPGALRCVVGQDTLLSQCFSTPRSILIPIKMATGEFLGQPDRILRRNPEMD